MHKLDGTKVIVKRVETIMFAEHKDFNKKDVFLGVEVEIFRSGHSGLNLLCYHKGIYFSIDARDTTCDKTIYIAGPMTGIANHNRPAFEEAEFFLLGQGYLPVNPHSLNHQEANAMIEANKISANTFSEDEIWAAFLREDIAEGQKCKSVFLLEGFENSRGATLECITFSEYGKSFHMKINNEVKEVGLQITKQVSLQF